MTLDTYTAPLELELREAEDAHYLEGICVPYERVTHRAGPRPEQFVSGAFEAALSTRATIKLTDYNHSKTRVPAGRSVQLEERSGGLWARFRFNRTPEGDSAYANVKEGVYRGLSVGFRCRSDEDRAGVRTITSAHLDHVSLVEEPAYADAVVLDVRAAGSDPLAEWAWVLAPRTSTLDFAGDPSILEGITRLRRLGQQAGGTR